MKERKLYFRPNGDEKIYEYSPEKTRTMLYGQKRRDAKEFMQYIRKRTQALESADKVNADCKQLRFPLGGKV